MSFEDFISLTICLARSLILSPSPLSYALIAQPTLPPQSLTAFSSFSSSAYWTDRNLNYNDTINPYLYDENSNIYPYISAYVDKIMNLGVTSVSGRLISYEECYPLPNEIKYCTVYGSDCWLGSHARNHSADAVYTISYGGSYSGYSYRSSLYVRPLILIPKDEL